MAITQVGTATTGGADSSGSFSVTKPTGVASGDVLLCFGASNEGAWDTLPSGFTQFAVSDDGDTTNNFRAYAWYKVCGGSEPSSYSFGSTTASGGGAPMVATISAWRGADTTGSPIANVSEIAGGSSSEPANPATSFTASATGRLTYCRLARSATAIPTFSFDTGTFTAWSELADAGYFSGGSVRYGLGLYSYGPTVSSGNGASELPVTCDTTDTDNVYILTLLKEAAATSAAGGASTATATSNAPGKRIGAMAQHIG